MREAVGSSQLSAACVALSGGRCGCDGRRSRRGGGRIGLPALAADGDHGAAALAVGASIDRACVSAAGSETRGAPLASAPAEMSSSISESDESRPGRLEERESDACATGGGSAEGSDGAASRPLVRSGDCGSPDAPHGQTPK
jgi:hypothetical protein